MRSRNTDTLQSSLAVKMQGVRRDDGVASELLIIAILMITSMSLKYQQIPLADQTMKEI